MCVVGIYWEKRTRRVTRGIAHIFAHPTNKQTKSLYITFVAHCVINKYQLFFRARKTCHFETFAEPDPWRGTMFILMYRLLSTDSVVRLLDTGKARPVRAHSQLDQQRHWESTQTRGLALLSLKAESAAATVARNDCLVTHMEDSNTYTLPLHVCVFFEKTH